MNKNTLGIIIALVVVGVIGAIFAMQKAAPASVPSPTPSAMNEDKMMQQSPQATSAAMMDSKEASMGTMMNGVREFVIEGSNFKFSPNMIQVKVGDKVKITFNNSGGFHDLKIDGLNVGTKQIKANDTDSFIFTADKAGTYEYYCSVGSHRQMGMKGTLVVQ